MSEKIPDELKNEPINWADLKCIDVYTCIQKTSPEHKPEICYCVVIDKVLFDAYKFKNYVRDNPISSLRSIQLWSRKLRNLLRSSSQNILEKEEI